MGKYDKILTEIYDIFDRYRFQLCTNNNLNFLLLDLNNYICKWFDDLIFCFGDVNYVSIIYQIFNFQDIDKCIIVKKNDIMISNTKFYDLCSDENLRKMKLKRLIYTE